MVGDVTTQYLAGWPASSSAATLACGSTVKGKSRKRTGDQPINQASEQDLINVAGCISALCSHAGGGFLPCTLRLIDVCFGEAKGTQGGWSPYYTERIRKV